MHDVKSPACLNISKASFSMFPDGLYLVITQTKRETVDYAQIANANGVILCCSQLSIYED